MRDFVSSEVDQSTAREKLRRSQSRGQMFGLAATTVFFVTLILNARINGACHATEPAGASAKPLRGRADDVPTSCLERDCLDRSLLCSLCLRSQRFSHVVVTRTASPQCPQRLISTGAQLIHVKALRTAPRYWYLTDPIPMDMLNGANFQK
jgi:hypothetical protein